MENDYQTILKIKREFEKDFLKQNQEYGVSLGYDETISKDSLIICIHAEKEIPKAKLPSDMKVKNIPLKVVIEEAPDFLNSAPPGYDVKCYNPLIGGCGVGAQTGVATHNLGTLGCFAIDLDTNKVVGLSNSHVFNSVGQDIYQIKQDACNVIGQTLRNTELVPGIDILVDGGITSLNRLVEVEMIELGIIKGTYEVKPEDIMRPGGYPVRKRGASSNVTYGGITNLNYTRNIRGYNFVDQLLVKAPGGKIILRSGDSGSVLMDYNSRIVGLLFAGNLNGEGFANPIETVKRELNIDILAAHSNRNVIPLHEMLKSNISKTDYGKTLVERYLENENEIQHIVHSNAKLYALWRKLPHNAIFSLVSSLADNPNQIVQEIISDVSMKDTIEKFANCLIDNSNDEIGSLIKELLTVAKRIIGKNWEYELTNLSL